MSALTQILNSIREQAKNQRDQGSGFEKLIVDFLLNEPIFASQFSKLQTFVEWAGERQQNAQDIGVDLVATNIEGGFCAIQCKFYPEDYCFEMKDFGTFFSQLGQKEFTRGIIIDTTRRAWSKNAEISLENQSKPVQRIDLTTLENSAIDWSSYFQKKIQLISKKTAKDYQTKAINAVVKGLVTADRGKLIMACGTGKTFTALKIAEQVTGAGKRVLFLVPSLALMSQSISEWCAQSSLPLRYFAVCSDAQVGKVEKKDDLADLSAHELPMPATTDSFKLAKVIEETNKYSQEKMTVIFSTYQSLEVISQAQKKHQLGAFDLIICDEAHRTTGAALAGQDESSFVAIHDQEYIKASKRLYMTATPRFYNDDAKTKVNITEKDKWKLLASMDDEAQYGKTLFDYSFAAAVRDGNLCRYKVIVLAVDATEKGVAATIQARQAENTTLKLDDVTKMIGCYRALSMIDATSVNNPQHLQRAVAFATTIKQSEQFASEFPKLVSDYLHHAELSTKFAGFTCAVRHVDGTMSGLERNQKLAWLKNPPDEKICQILSNARCLTEGVDVPSLDAVLFISPRKSQIDVVQAVGRVMRISPGKERGYVILPIVVQAGFTAEEALANNENYRVVVQVLSALKAHDDSLEDSLNKFTLGADISDVLEVVNGNAPVPNYEDNIPIIDPIDHLPVQAQHDGSVKEASGEQNSEKNQPVQRGKQGVLNFDEYQRGIYAVLVNKLVRKDTWAYWAHGIARIAQTYISRITGILNNPANQSEIKRFDEFLLELQDDLNQGITRTDAIEMLAQHIITRPVFDALFEGYKFTSNNPVSQAMQATIEVLDRHTLEEEQDETLKKFYQSVQRQVSGISDIQAKQKLIVKLYDQFFRYAFPKMTERLGIVYTPVEVVDFIIYSINDVLQSEFGQTLGSKGVHIVDPFTGTGTFITRLLQSGLIKPEEMAYKFANEIHANEIVLLAYYIAAINIEQVYHSIMGEYQPFNGICLTDTFALYEKEDLISKHFEDNSTRRKKQKALDIRVIMGNPPYSVGQESANDNNQNIKYPSLDERIRNTYARHSKATNKNALYDSYIRAFRWASDRIGDAGVIGFVTNAGYIDANTADGLRKCLADEFTKIYIFHLRGNARTTGELRRQERDNVFGQGSRAPVAITILVKNPKNKSTQAKKV